MSTSETIDWAAEQRRFEQVAYPFAVRAAKRAFKKWHERKRSDAEAEFLAKMWDQWARLLLRGKDPEPMLWPLIHWAKQWVYMDRRLAGRPRNLDIEDYRAGMTRHLMDERGQPRPHERSDRINGFLDWTGQARTDNPAELAAALLQAGMTLEEYLAA
ncbi:hypothetical protein [Tautonia plasticadhaerens]|uniref:Uncharacterized protein n=1 Tax=Tautonia plasticadhaerens TaxID=2527974 RepID=A0A518H7T0_9BACT|nr:hypothetical protein [Tautonia plasticadhaerens]QDV36910.1 hypothetical protein ElP_48400 [Tautonia plasticadhaerens]